MKKKTASQDDGTNGQDRSNYTDTQDRKSYVPDEALDNSILKLRLIVDVDYVPNGVSKDALEDMLKSIVDRAANDGLMTGETPAEVDTWTAKVSERSV
jgi:hypothetical protein